MSKLTKAAVLAVIKELGGVADPEAKYDELLAQLEVLRSTKSEVIPKTEEPRLEPSSQSQSVEEEPRLEAPVPVLPAESVEEDYLRQYQYRKDTQFGSLASDPVPGSKAERMKQFLLTSPKIRMFIPRPQGEDKTILQTVNLNGYRLDFPKQTYVEVPEAVADVLMESLVQTELAIQRDRIDGNAGREKALL